MTKVIPIAAFACTICGQQHPTPAEAIACHDSHPQPDYVAMSHICNACDEDCKTACKGGTCTLNQKSLSTPAPNKELQKN